MSVPPNNIHNSLTSTQDLNPQSTKFQVSKIAKLYWARWQHPWFFLICSGASFSIETLAVPTGCDSLGHWAPLLAPIGLEYNTLVCYQMGHYMHHIATPFWSLNQLPIPTIPLVALMWPISMVMAKHKKKSYIFIGPSFHNFNVDVMERS